MHWMKWVLVELDLRVVDVEGKVEVESGLVEEM